jgi:hypothetical protein
MQRGYGKEVWSDYSLYEGLCEDGKKHGTQNLCLALMGPNIRANGCTTRCMVRVSSNGLMVDFTRVSTGTIGGMVSGPLVN